MTRATPIQHSKHWESERSRHGGRPYITFKLRDPRFFGIKALHVYKTEDHWDWVWWDIGGTERRPQVTTGFETPDQAAYHAVIVLEAEATTIRTRRQAICEERKL